VNLADLLEQYGEAIARTVIESYPPLYDAEVRRSRDADFRRLLRRPLGAQADAINATVLSLQRHTGTIVVGEMGTGKSYIAAASAYLAGCRRTLIVSPPHLVKKWRREIQQAVPGAEALIIRTISDLEGIRQRGGDRQFIVCSRERAKLGYRWLPALVERPVRGVSGGIARREDGRIDSLLCCPSCFAPATDSEEVSLTLSELRTKKHRCRACGESLWQADRTGPHRVPLADYVRRRMSGYFDLLVLDEGHEYKARGSAQGLAAESLAGACARTLTLTGTLFGGYSSTLFYLLWRFSPAVRREFGYRDESKWVSRYGIIERVTKRGSDAYGEDGRLSKRRSYQTRTIEKPGVSASVLFHLIGNTVFLRLSDVAADLPAFTEQVTICDLDRGDSGGLPTQAACYERLAHDLRQATVAALSAGSKRLLATYLQTLLAYPDACTRNATVLDASTGSVVAHAPALPEDMLYPKERSLVELALRERTRGRRLLVYITHTERRDISPRLRTILERSGLRVDVLKADTVSPDRREEWLTARVHGGAEVLICHPRLVQTGLDLIDWPSICWYETEYSIYVMRQASRRSWRIGQRREVEVTHLVYRGTLQAEALALMSSKMRSSLMIEGDLPEDGLAALECNDQDVMLALARRLTDQSVSIERSLEGIFARSRAAEMEGVEYLVGEDGFATTVQPDPVERAVDTADLSDQERDGQTPTLFGGEGATCLKVAAESISFKELAQILRRPRPRRRAVPTEQLALFGD
jgi:hypothetical protein